jgi:ABC-type antimicrobial peptide transport system permease subunit
LRKTVASLYPNVPIEKPMMQQQQFEESYAKQRMFAAMGGFFGVLAALLVATGLYGSHSFRVSRRTTEIGIRMALGASRAQVLAMVMRESLWVLIAGLLWQLLRMDGKRMRCCSQETATGYTSA